MHILCPHCHNPIELVKIDPRAEIACPSCGSSFHLEGGSTTGWERQTGQKLGKFELIEPVGQGGCGTVYKARDPELDRIVAVKVPRAGNLAGPQELDRFLREARSAARLRHPAIVPVHEVGEQDGVPYLVSDFVQGVTLTDLLSARRPGFREAAELIAAVADALQYAHEHGIIHRDVKPSNVMVGEGGAVFVMDFGLARRDAGEITMTVEGQVLGTPAYMPPEQARGEGHAVDARGDVYSLGVVLYQLLTGELPFRGTQRMLLHQVLHDEPRPPHSLNDHIPRDLETIALKAMAKEPGRRYATARDFADDLRRWLAGEPIRARPVGRAERAVRWARRHPAPAGLVAVSGLAVLALVGLAVGLVYNTQLATAYEAEEEQRKEAEAARDLAVVAKQGESQQRERAEEALAKADQVGYIHSIFLADLALKENNLLLAQVRLKECKAELRNWEWRYLQAQCRPELFSFPGAEHLVSTPKFSPDGTRIAIEGRGGVRVYDIRTGQEAFALKEPGQIVQSAFSPDGTRLVASVGRGMQVYDARTGRQEVVLKGPTGLGWPVYSPNGTRVAAGSLDGVVRVFDTRTGQENFALKDAMSQRYPSLTFMFSPDGTRLAADNGEVVRVFDARTGREAFAPKRSAGLDRGVVNLGVFSPDGMHISVVDNGGVVRVYDARTGQEAFALKERARVGRAEYSPDGLRMAIRGDDGVARVYDARTGKQVFALAGRARFGQAIYSPDGLRMAIRGDDGVVRVYDARTGQETFAVKVSDKTVVQPVFSPDGARLAVVDSGGAVRVYDSRTGREAFALMGPGGSPVFSPDGTRLATVGGGAMRLYDARTGPETLVLKGPARFYSGVYSPDGTRVAASDGGAVRVYDSRTGREEFTLKVPVPAGTAGRPPLNPYVTTPPIYSPDGTRIAARGFDRAVRIYDAGSGKEMFTLKGSDKTLLAVYSPDGSRIAAAGGGVGGIPVYDARTGQEAFTLKGPAGIGQPAFSPDGTRLAVTGGVGGIQVYDARTGQEAFTLKGPAGLFRPVYSPDGTRLAVTGGGAIWVCDARTGQEAFTLKGPAGIGQPVYSPGGTRLAIRCGDGVVRVFDARTGKEVFALQGPTAGLTQPAYSPDSTRLVVAGIDGVIRVYDARTGQEAFTLKGPGHLGQPAFSPDGVRILAVDGDGALRVWAAPNDPATWQVERRQALAGGASAWHRAQTTESERDGHWFAAAFHWGWLASTAPDSGSLHFRRGVALTHLGRTAEVKVAFAKAVEAPNASPWDLASWGPQRLGRGDRTGYSIACSTLLDRFGKTKNPAFADEVAWTCAIAPEAVRDLNPAVDLARLAVRANPKNHYARNTLGSILFRAGQHKEAVRELNEAIQLEGRGGTSWNFLFLAMAHQHLGQEDEARTWLGKGLRVNASEKALNDTQRLTLQLLRREAETLLKGSAPPEKK